MAHFNHSSMTSNNYRRSSGGASAERAAVLASCYLVDSSAHISGLHYSTTGASGVPSPPSSPPLAAINSSGQIALMPKQGRTYGAVTRSREQRGGAALTIREDCERFFCETMATVFLGERNTAVSGSGLTSASGNTLAYLPTPPEDAPIGSGATRGLGFGHGRSRSISSVCGRKEAIVPAVAWAEIWDFQGGASFRAFVAEDDGVRTLFVFFHDSVVHLDLKPALMAIIELAEGPLGCQDVVALVDKRSDLESAKALMRSLQWVGFELTTLEQWAKQLDVTSEYWHAMCMEV